MPFLKRWPFAFALLFVALSFFGCQSKKKAVIRPQTSAQFDVPERFQVNRSDREYMVSKKKRRAKRQAKLKYSPPQNDYVERAIERRKKRQRYMRKPQYSDPHYLGKKESPRKRRRQQRREQRRYIRMFKKKYGL